MFPNHILYPLDLFRCSGAGHNKIKIRYLKVLFVRFVVVRNLRAMASFLIKDNNFISIPILLFFFIADFLKCKY